MSTRVFVYGTLLPGQRNHHYLDDCEPLGAARSVATFELYDMGTFPALVAEGASSVPGAVYRVPAEKLVWLDRLEQSPEWYRRTPIELLDADPAEAYLLPRAELPAEAQSIPGADWCAWARTRAEVQLARREDLETRWRWEPIPNCPGRSVFRGETGLTPEGVLGQATLVRSFRVPTARDEVLVAVLPDGGLISYRRPDGSYVHTLNTPEGFARKLAQLEIAL